MPARARSKTVRPPLHLRPLRNPNLLPRHHNSCRKANLRFSQGLPLLQNNPARRSPKLPARAISNRRPRTRIRSSSSSNNNANNLDFVLSVNLRQLLRGCFKNYERLVRAWDNRFGDRD